MGYPTRKASPPTIEQIASSLAPGSVVSSSLGYARLQGSGRGALRYTLRSKQITVGRFEGGADCELKSHSRKIARKHASIQWDTSLQQWTITCLSKKGVLCVNGIPAPFGCPPTVLMSRSLVEIGTSWFYFLLPKVVLVKSGDLVECENRIEQKIVENKKRAERKLKEAKVRELKAKKDAKLKRKAEQAVTKKFSFKLKLPPREKSTFQSRFPIVKRRPTIMTARKSTGGIVRSSSKKGKARARESSFLSEDDDFQDDRAIAEAKQDRSDYRREWTKKEKADFLRAINAVGVERIGMDDEGKPLFDWSRFRAVSPLPRKSDEILTQYYVRWIADVEKVLTEEEHQKRTKGPRTKHKTGCDCIVCENTRKSREKVYGVQDQDDGKGREEDDEAAVGKEERLVGLVTAQKYKKRMAILEAARSIDTDAGESVIEKLSAQPPGSGASAELPLWWENGRHDRAMMVGCVRFGVGQWKPLWASDLFADVREGSSEEHSWPSEKTAMKRLREVAGLINSSLRREQKKLKRKSDKEAQAPPPKRRRKSAPKKKNTAGIKEKVAQNDESEDLPIRPAEDHHATSAPFDDDDDADGEQEDKEHIEYVVEEIDESGEETVDEEEEETVVVEEEETADDDDDDSDDSDDDSESD